MKLNVLQKLVLWSIERQYNVRKDKSLIQHFKKVIEGEIKIFEAVVENKPLEIDVDYDLPFNELLKVSKFDRVSDLGSEYWQKFIPTMYENGFNVRVSGKRKIVLRIVNFHLLSEDRRDLRKYKLRHANLWELIHLYSIQPELGLHFPVHALGSEIDIITGFSSGRYHPCVDIARYLCFPDTFAIRFLELYNPKKELLLLDNCIYRRGDRNICNNHILVVEESGK